VSLRYCREDKIICLRKQSEEHIEYFNHRGAEDSQRAQRIKMEIENELATQVIGACIAVHRTLGPGLLESAYKECLFYELFKRGLFVEKEKPLPLVYEEIRMDCGYRLDIVIENKLILEIKAVEALSDVHMAQLLTYLKISGCKLGLLINFNVLMVKDGIRRVINTQL